MNNLRAWTLKTFGTLSLLGVGLHVLRVFIYYALLYALFFTMVIPLLEAYFMREEIAKNGWLLWNLFAQNFLIFAFIAEAWVVYKTDHSLLDSSLFRIFRYNGSRETDLYFWMYFTAVYYMVPIWIARSPYLSSLFPLYDLGALGGGLFAFLFLSWTAFAVHWLSHRIPFLWELHKVHHSATELTSITGPREHLVFEFIHLSIFVFFFQTQDMLVSFAFASRAFLNVLQHSQLNTKFGWLGNFIISPHAHRIHHLRNPRYFNRNFGSDITLWDRLFGTFQYEAPLTADEMQKDFGLSPEHNPGGERFIAHELAITAWRSFLVLSGARGDPDRRSGSAVGPASAVKMAKRSSQD
jgi:sterol desaturase/sphingolipid hydroxylase (fatty acid hydroxylase superfamily)